MANGGSDQRVALQLAVLASITTIATVLVYGAYWNKKQRQQVAQQPKIQQDPAAPKPSTHDAPKRVAKEPAPIPAAQKKPEQPPTPTNIGQDEALAATKKYKAGEYAEAIALYTLAIQQCEAAVPVDMRNLKVMFSNRAAAFEKLEDHESVINDCTLALALDKRHPKSYMRRAKARAALGDIRGALVDYVCLLVISEETHRQVEDSLAVDISRIHSQITAEEIERAQERKNPVRFLPDTFFITSYYSSFHPSDDENDVVADQSVEEYTHELEVVGEEVEVREQRGELLTKRGLALKQRKAYDEAAKDLKAACKLLEKGDTAFYTAQIENGTYHHLRGEFAQAKKCFENALAVKPHSVFAKIRMGGLCFDQKEMKQALEWFDQALAEKTDCSTAYFHRGQLYSIDMAADGTLSAETLALVVKDLERCVRLSPDFSMAYIQLGVTYARTGEFAKAVEKLQTAAKITPHVPEIYNYLGETYLQMMQMPGQTVSIEAVEDLFAKAIELDPSYPMAYINQGNLMVQRGSEHGHAALALFEKAVTMCPRSKFAYCHLAQVYMAMQDYARAIEQIDQAVEFAFTTDELNELFAIRVTAETHLQAKVVLH